MFIAGMIVLGMLAALYLLYVSGCMPVSVRRARMYVGKSGGWGARFAGCEGWIRRIVRVKESRVYDVELTEELTGGTVTAELRDAQKRTVLRLDGEHPRASVALEKGGRYEMTVRFQSATGSFSLQWR